MIDPARLLGQALSDASPDLMRSLLGTVINALLSADADAVCGAEYGQTSPERVNSRNGYRHRELDTRAGTIDVAIPKLRSGSYFPEWLLERRKRAEAALVSVVAACYLLGVSTRRTDKLVQTLGSPACRSRRCRGWRLTSNPTGIVHTRAGLGALGHMVDSTDTLLLADEAYGELVYTDAPFTAHRTQTRSSTCGCGTE